MTSSRIFLVAAEPSGDQLGREVAEYLRQLDSMVELAGIGGEEMAAAGLSSVIDTSPLSVLGLFEGLKAYPEVVKIADATADEIISFRPDAVVLIDSWGFMLRVAQRIRKRAPTIKLIKLIGPQVWATRAGRAKTLAKTVDHLLAIFDMEVPYYEPHNLKTTVIGSPAIGRTQIGDGNLFRHRRDIPDDRQILLLLPGSRPGEIKRVAPTLIEAAHRVKLALPDTDVIFAPAASVANMFVDAFPEVTSVGALISDPTERYNAMAAADLALACSGTVTTELAMQGTPFIVGYKLGWITWAIARSFLYKPKYMSILNIAAGEEIAPEFLQTKFKADAVADKAIGLLKHKTARADQIKKQNAALGLLGRGNVPAAKVAAEAILQIDEC